MQARPLPSVDGFEQRRNRIGPGRGRIGLGQGFGLLRPQADQFGLHRARSALHPAQASHATASLVILASYAADAVALGGPATLVAHARWLVGDSIAGGLAPTYVHDQLVALRAALGDVLSAAVGVGAAAVLDAAIAAT